MFNRRHFGAFVVNVFELEAVSSKNVPKNGQEGAGAFFDFSGLNKNN